MSTRPLKPQPCNVLPPKVRDMLIAASQTRDPDVRRVAIDAAIDYVKLHYPRCFHHEKE